MDETITFWFSGFEKGVEAMTPRQRETLFSACGQNCVKQGTLAFYQQIYEEAGGDLDMFFQKTNQVPGLRAEILAPGSKYIFCFSSCSCPLHTQGYVNTPHLCECSRQSVLYVLNTLWPKKEFAVDLTGSILRGDSLCRLEISAGPREAERVSK